MSTLKGILGDGAEEKIQNAMEILKSGGPTGSGSNPPAKPAPQSQQGFNLTPESMEMISQISGMLNRISTTNDSRSELLKSLRPFVRSERQRSIDKAIRLINIGRFSGIIGK